MRRLRAAYTAQLFPTEAVALDDDFLRVCPLPHVATAPSACMREILRFIRAHPFRDLSLTQFVLNPGRELQVLEGMRGEPASTVLAASFLPAGDLGWRLPERLHHLDGALAAVRFYTLLVC